MYLPVLFAVFGAALAVPIAQVARNSNADIYVLPNTTYPTFYDVSLFMDPDNIANFTGNVGIRILANSVTSEIVMHAMELNITKISVYSDISPNTDIFESFVQATDDTHFLTIRLTQNLQVSTPYTVDIDYVAYYSDNMFGVYISTYEVDGETRRVITSQLQPTYTRRAFPCYDEPAQKAVFRTTIYAPANYPVVRSNTVIRSDPRKEDVTGYVKHEFEDTLVMSSYLIAYLVSNFEYIENTENPIYRLPFRVYSRTGTQDTAAFALEFGQKNMVALEEYTEFNYEFPKMDKVAVPDFAAGAMENWGLVIYREIALLVQEGVTTTSTKQNIGRIICHENVHQWFGNEVGPLSWTYTWLNEGFATFFEHYATDLVLPEWRMMDQFVITMQNTFQFDSVLGVNPMTHEVYSPTEIIGTFNSIAYQKSGSVIRMLNHFLTPEVFRQGLIRYIKEYSRLAAHPSDLYASLQVALNESNLTLPYQVATIMDRWTTQGGFPVLTIRRSSPTANSVVVTQKRYLTDSSQTSTDQWHVPLNWALSTNPDFSDTRPTNWLYPSSLAISFDIPGLESSDWYICNKQQTGYYRVLYENENWEALAKVLNTNYSIIHYLNRAQLLDDAFNLARTGFLEYRYAFEMSRYLEQEKDYIPWAAANTAMTYLDLALGGTEAHELLKKYLLQITAPLYSELGFNAVPGEEHVTPYHRNIILNINCRLGNEHCVQTAQGLLEQIRNNPAATLNPDIQITVFCSGLRGGDVDNFNFLWERYLSTTDASEQSILLNSLGCTTNPQMRTFFLNQVIIDDSPVREQDRHSIVTSVINSSPENMEAALDFIIAEWPNIQPRVQGLTGTTNILNALSSRLTTQAHLNKFNEFIQTHQSIFSAGEQAVSAAVVENIGAAIAWNENNAGSVQAWLTDTFDTSDDNSGATALTSSLAILVSLFIALFNNY